MVLPALPAAVVEVEIIVFSVDSDRVLISIFAPSPVLIVSAVIRLLLAVTVSMALIKVFPALPAPLVTVETIVSCKNSDRVSRLISAPSPVPSSPTKLVIAAIFCVSSDKSSGSNKSREIEFLALILMLPAFPPPLVKE